jgi:acetyltransferase-like isoleucine patch superfamily enzyme
MKLLIEIYRLCKRWRQQKSIKYRLLHRGKVKIEDGVVINKQTQIGAYTFIGAKVLIGPAAASIGKFCSIASGSIIGPNSHDLKKATTATVPFVAATEQEFFGQKTAEDQLRYRRYKEQLNQHKVIIEDDVWMGHNAIIMPGVRVGTGAVIGSAAVVTKDVSPYSIVAGVPARLVRMRFTEITIDALLEHKLYKRNPDQLLALFNLYAQKNLEEVLPAFLADLYKIPLQSDDVA